MSGQPIADIQQIIDNQDWISENKQVKGPFMEQLLSLILNSFPNGVLADGKTIQEAITLLQQGGTGGGGNTFDPDYFKVAEGLVTFIAKYISLAPRTAVNVAGLTVSAVAPQQVALADGVYTLSLTQDFQNEELDIRFANGVIMSTGNRAKVSFDVKCENISQLSDFKFGLYLIEGANTWTYYDEITVPSTDYQSVSFIVDGDKVNDYTQFRLVLRSKIGAKVFLSNAKVYFDNVRFEYWPIGEAAGGLQLPVADLLLKTAGVVPEVPPAGKVPGDDGYDINLHLMPGQWAINTVDNLIFYNRDGVIQQFRAANNTDDLPLADPTKHSLLPTDVTLSDSLDTTRKAIIALRDTLREIIGAHAAIVAAPVPQAVGVANQQYTFDQDLPSSNEDVMVVDAALNLIYLYLAARYSYTTFGVVENTSSADRTLYFRIVDNDTNALLNPERSVVIPKNSIINLDWTVTTIEITEAKNVRLELRASGTGISILALETEISTAGGSVSGNPNDKGFFATEAALRAAHPTGQDGWYALIGETDTFWVWDSDTPDWVDTGANTTPITVDSALDDNSTNPVENRAIYNSLVPRTDYVTTPSIPFNHLQGFIDLESNALDLASGDIELSINTSFTNYYVAHFFYLKGDDVHKLTLGNGFSPNRTFPSDLNGKVLPTGTHMVCCINTPDGIVINVPALFGGAAGTAPTVVSATILDTNLSQVRVVYSRACNDSTGAGFSLTGTTSTSFSGVVSGSGTTEIVYSLASPAVETETIKLAYNSALGNVVASDDSTPLESFADFSVVVGDTTAPVLIGQTIGDVAANIVRYTFDEALNASFIPLVADMPIYFGGILQAVTNIAVSGNTVDVTVSSNATSSTVVTGSYIQSAGNELQDASGNKVSNFTDVAVSNLLDFGLVRYEANTDDVIFDGSNNVTSWADSSGNGDDLIISPTPPVYVSGDINGKDVVSFGSGAYCEIPNKNIISNSNGFTFICVLSAASGGILYGHDYPKSFDTNKGPTISFTNFILGEIDGDDVASLAFTIPDSNYHVLVFRWLPGKEMKAIVDNTVTTLITNVSKGVIPQPPEATNCFLATTANTGGSNNPLSGKIRFTQIFDKAKSDGEIKDIIDAWANDLGLTIDTSGISEQTPIFDNAVAGRQGDNIIAIYFDDVLDITTGDIGDFSVSGITGSPSISGLDVGVNYVRLTLSGNIDINDTPLVSYSGTSLKSPKGFNVPTFSNQSVSNYVLDESLATLVIDTRVTANAVLKAGSSSLEQRLDYLTAKVGAVDCVPHSTTHDLKYKEMFDGINVISNPMSGYGSYTSLTIPNLTCASNTNGMTIIAVSGKNDFILSKRLDYDNTKADFMASDTLFNVYTDNAGNFEQATPPVSPPTNANKLNIYAYRWNPGVEQQMWVNGVAGTEPTTKAAQMNISTQVLSLGAVRPGQTPIARKDVYNIIIPEAIDNTRLKSTIDKLAAIFDINVDTSGIV